LDESPYPEVRSAVANTDDPMMPASTFRAWVIGLIITILGSGFNQFFSFRYPIVYLNTARIPQLLKMLLIVLIQVFQADLLSAS
jgi:hypothetical protein